MRLASLAYVLIQIISTSVICTRLKLLVAVARQYKRRESPYYYSEVWADKAQVKNHMAVLHTNNIIKTII